MLTAFTIFSAVVFFIFLNTVVIVPMRSHFIIERLGKYYKTFQPGIHFRIPFFDQISYVQEIREQVIDIPSQSCITQDNMQVEVDGIVYVKVTDSHAASYGIGDYRKAAVNLAQTTMRSEVGKMTLGKLFSERESLNEHIVREIDVASDPWGIKVLRYEVMNIYPSGHVVSTLEKQMEAEREKRAEITLATAEKEFKINVSEGERQKAINISEGERQKRINEATGKAKEIELLADSTAQGIIMISKAIKKPGGNTAVKMQIVDQFIKEVGGIMAGSNVSVLPSEMANVKGIFEGVDQVSKTIASPISK